jgi:hypothetical protein
MYLVKKTTRDNIALAGGDGILPREPSIEEHAGANSGV